MDCSAGAAQPPAENAAGRHSPVGDEAALPGGDAASGERADVPAHLRHQPAQAARGSQRCRASQRHRRQPRPGRLSFINTSTPYHALIYHVL
jgi:hypothetical protein